MGVKCHGVEFSPKRQDCDGQSRVDSSWRDTVRKAERGDTTAEGTGCVWECQGSVSCPRKSHQVGPSLHCGFCAHEGLLVPVETWHTLTGASDLRQTLHLLLRPRRASGLF